MPKYSTGGAGSGGGGQACELCGSTADSLQDANVAGAELTVCPDCASHDESAVADADGDAADADRTQRAVENQAQQFDAVTRGDSSHWEEDGTNYETDQLPYLVSDYGERVVRARQDAGLQRSELAAELEIDDADVLAVEQARATKANVGGSVIAALEDFLDVQLSDD
ncbi:multiprotein-bridging factor 1 family protein [Halobacterium salinarum]|uniref:helix-turn-helix domain-containing protein n=1 Tax=Halobacterium salinarum TaxID=2242 RepID=UPI001F485E4C|nr:multiprotein-bridging factor 1 family protein [Halobacterium salinarum]MCF2206311.1 multiprotein-bridging factor 1 family protein [Halobacterium salinarum]MCF2240834.1 multiprotein-bridging factor 1 family protein [Halobacterium salinarum]